MMDKLIIKQVGLFIKSVVKVMTICMLLGVCALLYARYIEPELLVVKEIALDAKSLKLSKPLKIVQCSDLHLGPDYDMTHLERVVEKINALAPDLIVFTGDLIDDNSSFQETDETIVILSKLKARLGKYAVIGNHDYGGNGIKRYRKIMQDSGFKLLINERAQIVLENNQILNLIGLDDAIFGDVNVPQTMQHITKQSYNIVLCHEPDLADEVAVYPVDLQLSGHSHGGQVRVPFKGAILTPPKGKKYTKGLYDIEGNARMKLYVNVGIGTSQMRIRFGCLPELTVINLN